MVNIWLYTDKLKEKTGKKKKKICKMKIRDIKLEMRRKQTQM